MPRGQRCAPLAPILTVRGLIESMTTEEGTELNALVGRRYVLTPPELARLRELQARRSRIKAAHKRAADGKPTCLGRVNTHQSQAYGEMLSRMHARDFRKRWSVHRKRNAENKTAREFMQEMWSKQARG